MNNDLTKITLVNPGSVSEAIGHTQSLFRQLLPEFLEEFRRGEDHVEERPRHLVRKDRAKVAVLWRRGAPAPEADPVVSAVPGIAAFLDLGGLKVIAALRYQRPAFHLGGGTAGKIDVDQSAVRPSRFHQLAQQIGSMLLAWRPVDDFT